MLSFLSILSLSKRPIILIPGLMGSNLKGDILKKTSWYCPGKDKNVLVWFNDRYAIPPMYKCLFNYIKLVWNPKTQEPEQPDYINISIFDFGGIQGINSVDTALFGIHFVPYYSKIIEYLEKKGYIVGKDIFGLPFDWRYGVYQTESVWKSIIKLIEDIYEKSKQKITIVGHSMGGYLLHRLLTERTTAAWRKKYIESGIFIAPSFGGAGYAFNTLWTHKLPLLEFLGEFPDVITSLGGVHIHMPNQEVFGNKTIFIDKDGKEYDSKSLTKILRDNKKLKDDFYNIYMKNFNNTIKAPQKIDVPSILIHNSGLVTMLGIDIRDGNETYIYGKGDAMVNVEGPKWVCSHWDDIECIDLNSSNPLYNHVSMMYREDVMETILNFHEKDHRR